VVYWVMMLCSRWPSSYRRFEGTCCHFCLQDTCALHTILRGVIMQNTKVQTLIAVKAFDIMYLG